MSIDDLLNKMEAAEKGFIGTEFLAPMVGDNRVLVRIAGVVCQMRVSADLPERFMGWAHLKALSTSRAVFLHQASMGERDAYLKLFPVLRLILVHRQSKHWLALPAHQGDHRFQISGPVAILLPEEDLRRFDTIRAHFDGRLFWYGSRDPGRDPALAGYLREQLNRKMEDGMPPEEGALHKRGLSREERSAYNFIREFVIQDMQDRVEIRLEEALAHAGAKFRAYIERGDAYVVTYEVDGRRHVSTIRQDDLTVMTAGICLAGQDRSFDLTSLVGVLREAGRDGLMYWVGERGLDEAQYWEIQPPHE
jgi:hypothetical protein